MKALVLGCLQQNVQHNIDNMFTISVVNGLTDNNQVTNKQLAKNNSLNLQLTNNHNRHQLQHYKAKTLLAIYLLVTGNSITQR